MSYTVNVYGESGLIWSRDRASGDGAEFQPDRGLVKVRRVSVLVSDSPDRSAEPSPLVDLSGLMGYRLRVPRGGAEAVGLFKGAAFVQVGGHQWYSDDWSDPDATATAIEALLWPGDAT